MIEGSDYRFTVRVGNPKDDEASKNGTKLSRGGNFRCIMSDEPIAPPYIRNEGMSHRLGCRLWRLSPQGSRRVYLAPSKGMEIIAKRAVPAWKPEGMIVKDARAFTPTIYGMEQWSDLFADRQLVALTVFSELVQEVRKRVIGDALFACWTDDERGLEVGGVAATAYADSVAVY